MSRVYENGALVFQLGERELGRGTAPGLRDVDKPGVIPVARDLLAQGATTKEIKEVAYKQGFFTLADDGIRHIIEGATSVKEVARVADLTERMS